nr:PREDICTED: UPF0725 protein At4g11700-like [Rhinolophus sinicus]
MEGGFLITDLMPELPSEDPFKRFYVLKKSEVEDNDWILLYLELAVATTNRRSKDHHLLSNLKILNVAVETTQDQDHEPLLSAYDATFYIRFNDSCEGEDVDRIAIVRRVLQEVTFIVGRIESSETIIPIVEPFRRLMVD